MKNKAVYKLHPLFPTILLWFATFLILSICFTTKATFVFIQEGE